MNNNDVNMLPTHFVTAAFNENMSIQFFHFT